MIFRFRGGYMLPYFFRVGIYLFDVGRTAVRRACAAIRARIIYDDCSMAAIKIEQKLIGNLKINF